MIDIHCHVLPFLDDGAADWEAALSIASALSADGVTQCVATPHWTGQPGETEKALATRQELEGRLEAASIALKLHSGNEVVLVPGLVEALKEGRALTLAGSSYVLLETAQLEQGAYTHNALFQLQSNGYKVILAHPERVRSWQGSVGEVRDLLHRGCRLQVNAASLLGKFGGEAKKAAEQFLKLGWVSILASDAHSPGKRPPLIGPAFKRCSELIGEEGAQALVRSNPAHILCDEELPYVDAELPAKRGFFSFSWLPWRS